MIRQRSVPVSVEIIALPGPGNNNLSVTNMYIVFSIFLSLNVHGPFHKHLILKKKIKFLIQVNTVSSHFSITFTLKASLFNPWKTLEIADYSL